MRSVWFFSIFFFIAVFTKPVFSQDLLRSDDVNRIMQQILQEHITKKEMSGPVLQNAVNVYISQFDPTHIYFLNEEIAPFLNLSPEELKQMSEQYRLHQFTFFKKLNDVIQKAILRSRVFRKEIEQDHSLRLFQPFSEEELKVASLSSFPVTENQLKQRLVIDMKQFISSQKNHFGSSLTTEKKELILQAYEKKRKQHENQYLYQNDKGEPLSSQESENLFYIHILKALANSLDSHTTFYKANEAYDLRIKLQKEFLGVGVTFKEKENKIFVESLVAEGPAAKSGLIKVGDILLEIDGKSILGLSFDEVMELLHGEKNTEIKLTLKRENAAQDQSEIYTVQLKRVLILVDRDRVDVSHEPMGDGIIGKITLHAFYQGEGVSSEKDVKDAIEKLEREGKLKGLILDLRENSGGFLSQAVKVAGLFITNGIIVISKYSNGEERFYRDVDSSVSYDGPLVILTSSVTASAAEIVAQALQDYGVALVVGDETTYGKGTIQTQTVTNNETSSFFKVTVGEYYTISGHTPQNRGVVADIVVPGRWSKQKIGEKYLNSVPSHEIPAITEDQLLDISPNLKSWYLKYYTPSVQNKVTVWRNMLPVLKKNSATRISQNKNYQFFINGKVEDDEDDEEGWGTESSKTFGVEDLQMKEAVSILKDMIFLRKLESVSKK